MSDGRVRYLTTPFFSLRCVCDLQMIYLSLRMRRVGKVGTLCDVAHMIK
jgi:hypothetical protein